MKNIKILGFVRSTYRNNYHFGKLLPVVRSTPSIFAAVRGVRTRRYMLYSFLGSVLWSFGGVFAGNILTTYLGDKAIVVIVAILICSFFIIIAKEYIKKLNLRKSKIGNSLVIV